MLQRKVKALLHDMLQAIRLLNQFTQGTTYADYAESALLRSAVERQFVVIGEALAQLSRMDPEIAKDIRESKRIIAFRNILVHGYAVVDDRVVWAVLQNDLLPREQQVEALLNEPPASPAGNLTP